MKLKKVAALCSKAGAFCLYDREIDGTTTQWLGDGNAIYPLYGLPHMEIGNLCTMFDISAKKRESIQFRHTPAPDSLNLSDTDSEELLLDDNMISVISAGGLILKPLRTSGGIVFIQQQYLAPLEDAKEFLQLFERKTASGRTYIVAKTGLLITAIIMPINVVKPDFVKQLEDLAQQCRWSLNQTVRPPQQVPKGLTVDPETGEVLGAEAALDDSE